MFTLDIPEQELIFEQLTTVGLKNDIIEKLIRILPYDDFNVYTNDIDYIEEKVYILVNNCLKEIKENGFENFLLIEKIPIEYKQDTDTLTNVVIKIINELINDELQNGSNKYTPKRMNFSCDWKSTLLLYYFSYIMNY